MRLHNSELVGRNIEICEYFYSAMALKLDMDVALQIVVFCCCHYCISLN